jgi:Ca2+-binding EF-hand superfamily protein
VTAQQFERVLKNLSLHPAKEQVYDLIIRKYLDKGNQREVNYFAFCADVDRPEDMFPSLDGGVKRLSPAAQPANKTGSYFFAGTTKDINVLENRFLQPAVNIANDPSDVEQRLQAQVVMKRVRIEEFFKDFDKLRKGKVTVTQFKTVLSMLNFNLTDDEFQSLATKYNTPEGHFNYAQFTHVINSAFTQKGIDKDPNATVKPVTREDTYAARRKYLETTQEEEQAILNYIAQYQTAVINRRIHLKPQFQDFDITKCGHVTKSQFLRVLVQLGIYAPESILALIVKRYMDKGNADEVNYVDFCNEVDTHEGIFGVGRSHNQSFDYYPRTQPRKVETDIVKLRPDDVDDVLARIRLFCKQQRTRVSEFFRDFDKLRSGFITESQFRIGLNMAKIVLSSSEFEQLVQHFRAPKEGRHVRWRDFSDSVDEVFTKKGLEKAVDLVLDDVRTQTFYGRSDATSQERQTAASVVNAFREWLQRNRLDPKSFF